MEYLEIQYFHKEAFENSRNKRFHNFKIMNILRHGVLETLEFQKSEFCYFLNLEIQYFRKRHLEIPEI